MARLRRPNFSQVPETMPKTNFVRVATSGPTIDGRNIDPKALEEMAQNYDPNTYTAVINTEHIRGLTGQPPFQTGGDVLALKTEQIELNVGGKLEKRTALYAQLDVNDNLMALNKQGQKLFTSIEIVPDFAGKGTAYLGGLAVTDSPASLGTDRLKFTAHSRAFNTLLSKPDESAPLALEFDAASQAEDTAAQIRAGFTDFFKSLFAPDKPATRPEGFTPPVATPPAQTPPAAPAVQLDFAAFQTEIKNGFAKVAEVIEANQKASDTRMGQIEQNFTKLKTDLETTPASGYTARPTATGGSGQIQAEF